MPQQQNGHASPEIHLRGAQLQQEGAEGGGGGDQEPHEGGGGGEGGGGHDMDHVQDAISQVEDPKELNGLIEVRRWMTSNCDTIGVDCTWIALLN